MSPIVSIIIPCYNHGKYIQDALDSIELAKNKYPIEIIIVNDGSTDQHTLRILSDLENKGYLVLNQKNGGLGNARNNGIKLAKGKYILPLDSDNMVLNHYLNTTIDIFEENQLIDIVYGNATYFGEKQGNWIVGKYNLLKLIPGNYIDACAVYRKSVWEDNGGYDENMPAMGVEDWDFWLNSSFRGFNFFYLNQFCFSYRVLSNSMIHSMSNIDGQKVLKYVEAKYREDIFTESLEYYFFEKMNSNNHKIAKYIGFKSLFFSMILKVKSKFFKIK